MYSKIFPALFICAAVFFACSSDKVKQGINKAGDVTGQAVGEFAEGVSSGVEKVVEPKLELADDLKNSGISFGKITVSNDSLGTDNLLTVYVIFSRDFSGVFSAKAFNAKNEEMGRIKQSVNGKADEAKYIEFHFDRRTDIDSDSRIVLE